MKTRILTGAGITCLILSVLALSHIPWILSAVIGVLCVTAVWELYGAVGLRSNKPLLYVSLALAAGISFFPVPSDPYFILAVFLGIIGLAVWFMYHVGKRDTVPLWAALLFALGMVSLYNTVPLLRQTENGLYLLGLSILTPVITDIGAYFTGRSLGKHKMAPTISPNKTVEGAVGGIVCTTVLGMLAAFILDRSGIFSVSYGMLFLYLLIASVMAEFGDLALSAIKRIVAIKDYGKLFPGHGGVLDRFDSLLFVLPVTCLFAMLGG